MVTCNKKALKQFASGPGQFRDALAMEPRR
jgi:hypothetical protein